jgi:hypothetical protein
VKNLPFEVLDTVYGGNIVLRIQPSSCNQSVDGNSAGIPGVVIALSVFDDKTRSFSRGRRSRTQIHGSYNGAELDFRQKIEAFSIGFQKQQSATARSC